MADIRIKDLPTTATQTASDDFIALDGTVNGTRKIDASAPSFKTSVTSPSVVAPTTTNLTLAGGSTGATVVIGQGTTAASATITPTGTGNLLLQTNAQIPTTGCFQINNTSGAAVWQAFTSGATTMASFSRSSNALLIKGGGGAGAQVSVGYTGEDLTLAGGSTGASLVLGQGANGNATLALKTSARFNLTAPASNDAYIEYVGNAGTAGTTSVVVGQSGAGLGVIYNRSNSALTFGTNSLERGRFTDTGNLLIGTTTDGGQKLQVNGTASFAEAITVTSSAGLAASFTNATDNNWSAKIIKSGGNELQLSGNITANSGPSIRAVTSGGAAYAPLTVDGSTFTAKISSVAALTIASTGNATFAGAVTAGGNVSLSGSAKPTILLNSLDAATNGGAIAFASDSSYKWLIKHATNVDGNLFTIGTATGVFTSTPVLSLSYQTAAATFAGAVTVNGKIASSVSTATGYNQLYDTTGITTGRGAFAITSTGAGLAFGVESSVGGTSFTGSTAYASYFGTTTATPIHFVTNSVIRQTISSTGAATFAGSVTAADSGFILNSGGSMLHSSNSVYLSAPTSLVFRTNAATPTPRLTLTDTTATFAGAVTVTGSGSSSDSFKITGDTAGIGLQVGTTGTVNLYRAAADKWGTDDAFSVGGAFTPLGNIYFPTNSNLTSSGSIGTQASAGLSLWSKTGSIYDFTIYDAAGNLAVTMPTGTRNLSIASTTPSGGAGSGALQVAGGIYSGANSVFGGDVTRTGSGDSIIKSVTTGTTSHGKFNTVADVAQATLRTEGSATSGTLFSTNRASATQLYSESGPLVLGAFGAYSAVIGTNNVARLTIDSTGAATFAGAVSTTSTGFSAINASGSVEFLGSRSSTGNGVTVSYKTGATLNWFHGLRGLVDNNWYLFNNSTSTNTLIFDYGTNAATFAGTVIAPAATTAISSVRLPHGTAPTSPVNGDMWTTTAGLYVRINGVTVGPLS